MEIDFSTMINALKKIQKAYNEKNKVIPKFIAMHAYKVILEKELNFVDRQLERMSTVVTNKIVDQ